MSLRGFERRLEGMVEGVFARAFRSGLRPVELGRRLTRTMDDERSVDVNGRTIAPNDLIIRWSEEDHDRFADVGEALARELAEAARDHARDKGYVFMGPITVTLDVNPHMRTGRFAVEAHFRTGPGGSGAGSLVLGDGQRFALGEQTVRIGRLSDCDIVIEDPNASRHHAQVQPDGDGYVLSDLGSTNGTRVNGVSVTRRRLQDGDTVTIANHHMRFEAS
jgi:Protein of unknown function (DUF3662)/FHA domain